MDPKVNGQLQTEWGWLIAIYLFLGGVGAGAYTIAAINSFMGEGAGLSTTIGLWISFPALMVGSACLLADLGSPGRAYLAGMRPKTSWRCSANTMKTSCSSTAMARSAGIKSRRAATTNHHGRRRTKSFWGLVLALPSSMRIFPADSVASAS